jgi:hypothetical protein
MSTDTIAVRAPKKPRLENWEPIPPQKQPHRRPERSTPSVARADYDPDIAWKGPVRFKVPAGSKLELNGQVPHYIRVPISGVLGLIIKGDPSYLAAIDLDAGSLIQGELIIRRSSSPGQSRSLANATLVVGGPSFEPRYELRVFRSATSGAHFPKKLKGWCKLLSGANIQVLVIEPASGASA